MPSATMTDPESKNLRSLSPPPCPPTALTPGPRATRFVEVVDGALATTLKAISYDNFAACFPTIAENALESLENIHGQVTRGFGGFAKTEFEAVFKERNVIENMNALEDLIADAQRRKSRAISDEEPPTPPYLLPPSKVLAAHLASSLASQQSTGNARLQNTQSKNSELYKEIQAQRAEIEAIMKGLEETVGDLAGAIQSMNGEISSLKQETRDAEVEMNGL